MTKCNYLRLFIIDCKPLCVCFRCWSMVGRVGGEQKVSIGRGCERLGTAIHEISHSLGFWHEQVCLLAKKLPIYFLYATLFFKSCTVYPCLQAG